jgi:predicted transcriptional regulator
MEDGDGIGGLFFELASQNRLVILRELRSNSLKMNEIARRQDLTATETVRQLKRLSEALLIERQPGGSYTITQYGMLVLHMSSSLGFLFKHRSYFLTHDVWRLPIQFIDRLGELSESSLSVDTMESIRATERIIAEAKQFFWGIGEGHFTENMNKMGAEQVSKGVEYRIIIPLPPAKSKSIEGRSLSDVPVLLALTENEASVSFRLNNGKADYSGFIGKDPVFLNWVKDVFLHYWAKAKQA